MMSLAHLKWTEAPFFICPFSGEYNVGATRSNVPVDENFQCLKPSTENDFLTFDLTITFDTCWNVSVIFM